MRLTAKVDDLKPVKDDANDGTRDWVCTPCGTSVKGAHGHCSTCHLTFPQQVGFDRHRVGKFENKAIGQVNTRRCLTPDEMRDNEWLHDADADLWRAPLPKRKDAS